MQSLDSLLAPHIAGVVETVFGKKADPGTINLQRTNPQFEGDVTLVVFPFVKLASKSPEQTGQLIGEYLESNVKEVLSFNVVKGFLNLVIAPEFWLKQFIQIANDEQFGRKKVTAASPFVIVEYSSPNTNKPLHLGHVRNNLIGYSISEILKADGNRVLKANLINDRGIHICKSMLAWQKWGNGETPQSGGMKGDHLVGKYYVEFDKQYKVEIADLINRGKSQEEAEKESPLMREAQAMLLKWEAGDKEVRALWEKMNAWVYDGFSETYKKLGVDFDKIYYESETYLLGKEIIESGLKKGVLEKPAGAPGPVTIDLTAEGLDKKVLLRSDGTSVYMTQDLGTAVERHKEFPFEKHIYVVGNEQDYHFRVLKLALKKLGYEWADGLFHLSYGMVELPEGKMKSREGTVVDADELIGQMENNARVLSEEKGMVEGMNEQEQELLSHIVGMAALKYFILKVDPRKKMLFNPKESIDLQGNTGPFIQYTHARIRSIWRKSGQTTLPPVALGIQMHEKEKELIKILHQFPAAVSEAARSYDPSAVANLAYELAKTFNQFYDACPVLKEENQQLRDFRLALVITVASTIKTAMSLLGIEVPEKM
ncbi:MAG TPA: arginine--tRNA ligase [Bacteroidia bacterium]|nr:arginine--tRNA ligase [Bacteroidia bacterium]